MDDNQDVTLFDRLRVIVGVLLFMGVTATVLVQVLVSSAYDVGSPLIYTLSALVWLVAAAASWWLVFRSRWRHGGWIAVIAAAALGGMAFFAAVDI